MRHAMPLLMSILAASTTACRTTDQPAAVLNADSALGQTPQAPKLRDVSQFVCSSRQVKVAFFDADSTLRVTKSGSPSADSPDDVQLIPLVVRKIAELNQEHYLVAIVSNQGGVGAGFVTAANAAGGLREAALKISAVGSALDLDAHVDYIDMAEGKDRFRKPDSGMAQMLSDIFAGKTAPDYQTRGMISAVSPSCQGAVIDWSSSLMVGDAAYKKPAGHVPGDTVPATLPGSKTPYPRKADDFSNGDRLFAENMTIDGQPRRIQFFEPADFFGWWAYGVGNVLPDGTKPKDMTPDDLMLSDFIARLKKNADATGDGLAVEDELVALERVNGVTLVGAP